MTRLLLPIPAQLHCFPRIVHSETSLPVRALDLLMDLSMRSSDADASSVSIADSSSATANVSKATSPDAALQQFFRLRDRHNEIVDSEAAQARFCDFSTNIDAGKAECRCGQLIAARNNAYNFVRHLQTPSHLSNMSHRRQHARRILNPYASDEWDAVDVLFELSRDVPKTRIHTYLQPNFVEKLFRLSITSGRAPFAKFYRWLVPRTAPSH